jgi:hypothetical protein
LLCEKSVENLHQWKSYTPPPTPPTHPQMGQGVGGKISLSLTPTYAALPPTPPTPSQNYLGGFFFFFFHPLPLPPLPPFFIFFSILGNSQVLGVLGVSPPNSLRESDLSHPQLKRGVGGCWGCWGVLGGVRQKKRRRGGSGSYFTVRLLAPVLSS